MKIYLTRHGETIENVKDIMQGHLDGTLSKKGVEQAKKLAKRLKDKEFDVIYSSDLGRSANTAKEIAKFHPDTPIYFVKELRERSLGRYEGMLKKDIKWSNNLHDIESLEHMTKRAKNFLDKVYKEHQGQKVLIVGHGGINCHILSLFSDKTSKEIFDNYHPHNTSLYIIEFDEDDKGKIVLENCIKHLE